jgi:hypothetical protein
MHEGQHTQTLVCEICKGGADRGVVHNFASVAGNGKLVCAGCNMQKYPNEISANATINVAVDKIVVSGAGVVVTIVGGEYAAAEGTIIEAKDGAEIIIEGGEFYLTNDEADASAALVGDIEIVGGTFGFNPIEFVADGYKAVGSVEIEEGVYAYYTVEYHGW